MEQQNKQDVKIIAKDDKEEKQSTKVMTIIMFILVFALCIYLLFFKPFSLVIVKGKSMEPTLKENQILFLYKGEPQINGLVVVDPPKSWTRAHKGYVIKRIVAGPGDTIKIKDSMLYINGEENRVLPPIYSTNYSIEFSIGPEGYFIMGDNTSESSDSLYRLYQLTKDKNLLAPNYENDFLITEDRILYVGNAKR